MNLFFRLWRGLKLCFLVTVLGVSSLSMSACKGLELEDKTEVIEGYTESQAMIVLVNERNRYVKAYTFDILSVEVEGEDAEFAEMLTDNVKEYLEQLRLLCRYADEYGVTVTSQERDSLRTLSEKYYATLTEADLEYIGCTVHDVQTVYEDLFQAEKLITQLTSGVQSEISDSEAKVIEIQQIATSELKRALAILKLIKIDGADFVTMAGRYNEADTVSVELKRGTVGGLYEDTAFSLETGEVSNIIESGGIYYILKCVNDYDEKATMERKDLLNDAIKTDAFEAVYQSYRDEHNVRFAESFWLEVDLSDGKGSTTDRFFELYWEAFP